MSPDQVAARLNRLVPQSHQLRFDKESPFGDALQLQRWSLPNGLTVLTMLDRSAPVVGYQSWFGIGSRDELPGKTGLAHFFEHLMFNATPKFPQGEFDARLEAAGAENNAATWTDWTHYYETLPKSELGLAIELEADRLENLELRPAQIESEQEVVASERRNRIDDDVEGKANEALYQLAYSGHGYAHPTLGWMRDIEAYTRADCVAFYETYYSAANATVVIAGDFDMQEALGLVQQHYGALPHVTVPARMTRIEPVQTEERRSTIKLPTTHPKLSLGYKGPALADSDWRILSVAGDILFGGRSSRLHREVVVDKEICTGCYGSIAPFEEPGLYEIWAGMREGHQTDEALARIDAAITTMQTELVDHAELEKTKAQVELGLLSSLETISGKAEQVGFDELVLSDPCASMSRIDAYRAITREDIRRVANQYFKASQRTVLQVLPNEQGAES